MKKPTKQEQKEFEELAKKSQNPDEQIATRGYVKCIARTVHSHNHRQDMTFTATGLVAAISWLFIIVSALLANAPRPTPEIMYWCAVSIAITTTAIATDLASTDDDTTAYPRDIDAIKKYKKPEPKCEAKDEYEYEG